MKTDSTRIPGIYQFENPYGPTVYRRWDGIRWYDGWQTPSKAKVERGYHSPEFYYERIQQASSVTWYSDVNGDQTPPRPASTQLELF